MLQKYCVVLVRMTAVFKGYSQSTGSSFNIGSKSGEPVSGLITKQGVLMHIGRKCWSFRSKTNRQAVVEIAEEVSAGSNWKISGNIDYVSLLHTHRPVMLSMHTAFHTCKKLKLGI